MHVLNLSDALRGVNNEFANFQGTGEGAARPLWTAAACCRFLEPRLAGALALA